jgi:hypothetical protein
VAARSAQFEAIFVTAVRRASFLSKHLEAILQVPMCVKQLRAHCRLGNPPLRRRFSLHCSSQSPTCRRVPVCSWQKLVSPGARICRRLRSSAKTFRLRLRCKESNRYLSQCADTTTPAGTKRLVKNPPRLFGEGR